MIPEKTKAALQQRLSVAERRPTNGRKKVDTKGGIKLMGGDVEIHSQSNKTRKRKD